jgi:hypothetical protein
VSIRWRFGYTSRGAMHWPFSAAALIENLNARGVIPDIKARLQSEVLSAVQRVDAAVPRPPPTALLINDLIREYLSYTGARPCSHSIYLGYKQRCSLSSQATSTL